MQFPVKARDVPGRIAAGGYILHTGLEKWHGDAARAEALHRTAANAFPVLKKIPPERFLRLLAATEITVGSALLVPVVPGVLAGAGLTGLASRERCSPCTRAPRRCAGPAASGPVRLAPR